MASQRAGAQCPGHSGTESGTLLPRDSDFSSFLCPCLPSLSSQVSTWVVGGDSLWSESCRGSSCVRSLNETSGLLQLLNQPTTPAALAQQSLGLPGSFRHLLNSPVEPGVKRVLSTVLLSIPNSAGPVSGAEPWEGSGGDCGWPCCLAPEWHWASSTQVGQQRAVETQIKTGAHSARPPALTSQQLKQASFPGPGIHRYPNSSQRCPLGFPSPWAHLREHPGRSGGMYVFLMKSKWR